MENNCRLCHKYYVSSKKRPLCQRCYTVCRNVSIRGINLLQFFPIYNGKETTSKNMIAKYSEEFLADLQNFAANDKLTLRAVGDKYGLTRERIRQIYNRIMPQTYTEIVSRRKEKKFSNQMEAT